MEHHAPTTDHATKHDNPSPPVVDVPHAGSLPAPGTPSLHSPGRRRDQLHSPSSTSSSTSVDGGDEDEGACLGGEDATAAAAAAATAVETPRQQRRFAGKTILIISGGTRGDVQPAAALGVALAGEGAAVRLAADVSFRGLVEPLGLDFYPLGGNARDMMALTVKWGGMLPTETSGMFWLRTQIREVMDSVWGAATHAASPPAAADAAGGGGISALPQPDKTTANSRSRSSNSSSSGCDSSSSGGSDAPMFKPDLILANQLAYGQVSVAERLGVPLHIVYTIPWLPTHHFPHPWARAFDRNIAEWVTSAAEALLTPLCGLLRVVGRAGWGQRLRLRQWVMPRVAAAANRMSTPLLDHTAWSGIADLLAGFRRRLQLPLLSANNLGNALYRYPTTCLFSPLLVPKPDDWPSHVTLSGFLSLPEALARYGSSSNSSISSGGSGPSNSLLTCLQETNSSSSSSSCSSSSECFLLDATSQLDLSSSSSSGSRIAAGNGSGSSSSSSSSGSSSSGSGECLTTYTPPADLQAFLSAGPPPIYIGFGSMVVQQPQALMDTVLQAAAMLTDSSSSSSSSSSGRGGRVRLLVCSGWSGGGHASAAAGAATEPQQQQREQQRARLSVGETTRDGSSVAAPPAAAAAAGAAAAAPAGDGPEVFFTSEVPHEWLFPRCSVLVHHGGVGTTAVGLKHAKPTLVVAAFGDLFFWGDMCAELGVGPPPLTLKHLSAQQLAGALRQLLDQPTYAVAAQRVAAGLRCEDGLEAALLSVHATLCGGGGGAAARCAKPSRLEG